MLKVDGMYLGYDLSGKDKEVLARDGLAEDLRDIRWGGERDQKLRLARNFRVANGARKGWWVGLGPTEEGGGRPRARLILVKDRKDAAAFRWTRPEDEWAP